MLGNETLWISRACSAWPGFLTNVALFAKGILSMIRLERILFPTDFSENARCAQEYAWALAEQFQSELHVLYVLQDVALVMPEPGTMFALPAFNLEEVRLSAERALMLLPALQWPNGRMVRSTRAGSPFVEIVRYAA